MQSIYNLKIATKLLASFSAVLLLCAALGVFSISQLAKVNQTSTDMEVNWMPSIRVLLEIKSDLQRIRTLEYARMIYTEEDMTTKVDKSMADSLASFKKENEEYVKLISEPEEKRIYADFTKNWEKYLPEHDAVLQLARDGKIDEAREKIKGDSLRLSAELSKEIEDLVKINVDGGNLASHTGDVLYNSSRLWIIGMLIACVVLGFSLALWIARIVSGPLNEALRIAQTVAGGDLTSNIVSSSSDETGLLMRALKDMNDSLLRIVSQVRAGTDTIATASSEIASGNLDLSSRTEEQAGSLEETASSMEELTSTVKQNSDNARSANQLAASASDVAVRGGNVVSEVVNTMGSINDSSKKIVDIISVIDGIAFQTNILALNAAVEAARAGEQGRGFAVVATEVRNLAQRSAAAAKEIKTLIGDSVEKVDAGSKLVNQAGSTMDEIVASVRRVNTIIGEIATASIEQEAGINQINQAITEMDTVTQQNAALVEEAAAAADSLQDQAKALAEIVSVFKIDAKHIQLAAKASPPRPKPKFVPPVRKTAIATRTPAPAKRLEHATTVDGDDWEQF